MYLESHFRSRPLPGLMFVGIYTFNCFPQTPNISTHYLFVYLSEGFDSMVLDPTLGAWHRENKLKCFVCFFVC